MESCPAAYRLRTDWPTDPSGRTRHWPRFAWQLDSASINSQVAFELCIRHDPLGFDHLAETSPPWWSTGRVESDRNHLDLPSDPGWASGRRLWWSVRLADTAAGAWSAWAEPSAFRMALRDGADWGAAAWVASPEPWGTQAELAASDLGEWIWAGRVEAGRTEQLMVEFQIDPQCPAVSAGVVLAVNDAEVCDAELKLNDSRLPNFGYRTHRPGDGAGLQLVEGEAATFLRPGVNTVWLNVRCDDASAQPGVALRLDMTLSDGTRRTIETNPQWRWLRDGVPVEHQATLPSRGRVDELEDDNLAPLWRLLYPEAPATVPAPPPRVSLRRLWPTPHPAARFRSEFHLTQPAAYGTLFLSARGIVEAHLNGRALGDRRLDPAPSNYDHTVWQTVIALDEPLGTGRHALGCELAGGFAGQNRVWVGGLPGLHAIPEGIAYGKPAVRAVFQFHHADGSCSTVVTGPDWRTSPGSIRASNLYSGEHHDLATETRQAGWCTAGFDDANWSPVEAIDLRRLDSPRQPIPPCRVVEAQPALSIDRPTPGVQVVDFGRNIVGHAKLRVAGLPGTTVRVRFAERLHRDGSLDALSTGVRATRVAQEDTFVLDRNAPVWLEPHFVYHGFRYAQITSDQPIASLQIADAEAQLVHTDVGERGGFDCSHPMLNRYLAASRASYLGNLHGLITDCPHRERGAWHADIEAACAYGLYGFDTESLYQKTLQDTVGTLDENGLPYYLSVGRRLHPPNLDIGWASVIAEVPWRQWRMRGDRALLAMAYPHAVRAARWFVSKIRDRRLAEAAWGDHAAPSVDAHGRPLPPCPKPLYASLKLCDLLHRVRQMARVHADRAVGREMAEHLRHLRVRLRNYGVANRGKSQGVPGLGHPVAEAWALNSRLFAPRDRPAVFRQLQRHLEILGQINPGGFFGHAYVLKSLFEHGSARDAIHLWTHDVFPSIAWSLEHDDATSIYEYLFPHGSLPWRERSCNHPPFGGAASLLWSHLAGIRFGYTPRHLNFYPRPDADLDHIHAWHDTPDGRIETRLEKQKNGHYTWTLTTPPQSVSAFRVPSGWQFTDVTRQKKRRSDGLRTRVIRLSPNRVQL